MLRAALLPSLLLRSATCHYFLAIGILVDWPCCYDEGAHEEPTKIRLTSNGPHGDSAFAWAPRGGDLLRGGLHVRFLLASHFSHSRCLDASGSAFCGYIALACDSACVALRNDTHFASASVPSSSPSPSEIVGPLICSTATRQKRDATSYLATFLTGHGSGCDPYHHRHIPELGPRFLLCNPYASRTLHCLEFLQVDQALLTTA